MAFGCVSVLGRGIDRYDKFNISSIAIGRDWSILGRYAMPFSSSDYRLTAIDKHDVNIQFFAIYIRFTLTYRSNPHSRFRLVDRVNPAWAILLLKTHAERSFLSQRLNPVTSTTFLGILREVVSSPHSFS
jgi:hypothetical protein